MTITLDDILAAAVEHQEEQRRDPAVATRLYVEEGWSAGKIAQHLGLARSTVYRRLEKAGVYQGSQTGGAPRKDRCKRNHDLAKWGRDRPSGGRSCLKCKQIRERARRKGRKVTPVGQTRRVCFLAEPRLARGDIIQTARGRTYRVLRANVTTTYQHARVEVLQKVPQGVEPIEVRWAPRDRKAAS